MEDMVLGRLKTSVWQWICPYSERDYEYATEEHSVRRDSQSMHMVRPSFLSTHPRRYFVNFTVDIFYGSLLTWIYKTLF